MKPAFHHYLLAHAATFSIIVGIVGAVGVLFFTLHLEGILMGKWPVIGWIVLATIPVAGIGYIVGVIFIWMILGGVVARIQGWPFSEGDDVIILSGKNRGKVARVYEVWESRGQVRLDLGGEARKAVTDVYCAVAITRAGITEQTGSLNNEKQRDKPAVS